jgi:hypothetical protein
MKQRNRLKQIIVPIEENLPSSSLTGSYGIQYSPIVKKASQNACNQMAKVKENDIKPITMEAMLTEASAMTFVG